MHRLLVAVPGYTVTLAKLGHVHNANDGAVSEFTSIPDDNRLGNDGWAGGKVERAAYRLWGIQPVLETGEGVRPRRIGKVESAPESIGSK
jgi:hypothetical protein